MARPIKLVKEELLREASERYHLGVPVRKILVDLDIHLSILGLVKLIRYFDIAEEGNEVMYNAIFPNFLHNIDHTKRDHNVTIQDKTTHEFEGNFPYGVWIDKR